VCLPNHRFHGRLLGEVGLEAPGFDCDHLDTRVEELASITHIYAVFA